MLSLALREGEGLLMPGGPRRVEVLMMSDLLRKEVGTTIPATIPCPSEWLSS